MSDGPLAALIEWVRHRAMATRDDDYGFVDMAACLFAVGSRLAGDLADSSLEHRPKPKPFASTSAAFDHLESLSDGTDLASLYETAVCALLTFENELSWPQDAQLIPSAIVPDHDLLGGSVQIWIRRRRPVLAALRERRRGLDPSEEEAAEKDGPMTPREHPSRHLKTLSFYWHTDVQLPAVERVASSEDIRVPLIADSGGAMAGEAGFRVALCPLAAGPHPLFTIAEGGGHFHVCRDRPMHRPDDLTGHLGDLLAAAAQREVHLVVLPELTVDEASREVLREGLRTALTDHPHGIVAGSFHVWREGNELPLNESVLYDHAGCPLLAHYKRGRFRITREQFEKGAKAGLFTACERYAEDPGLLRPEIFESRTRELRPRLRFLETAFGRLALLICADAIEPDPVGFVPVVERLRPDLLVLVSMSFETGPFESFVARMAELGVGTLLVNAACVCGPEKAPCLALMDLALFEPSGAPPARLRWPLGGDVEYFDWHRDAGKGWADLGNRAEEAGVSWLEVAGEKAGLVLDLGVHWRFEGASPLAKP